MKRLFWLGAACALVLAQSSAAFAHGGANFDRGLQPRHHKAAHAVGKPPPAPQKPARAPQN